MSTVRPGRSTPAEPAAGTRALAETPEQDYVGQRDLAEWRTRAGQTAARLAVHAARWAAPHRLLFVILLIGVVLVGALSALAAQVYEAVVEHDGVAGLDQPALDLAVGARTDIAADVVTVYTNLGGAVTMPIVAGLFALTLAVRWRQWTPVLLLAATAAGTLTITWVGKAAVGRLRPPLESAVPPYEHSFSFPSGHAVNSIAVAGILVYVLVRRQRSPWARATTVSVACVFALTMGLSRVYLGHHWLTDVLVAWTLGLAWLTTIVTAHRLFITVRRPAAPSDGGRAMAR